MDAEGPFRVLIIIGIIALVIGGAIFAYLQEKKRRDAFRALAERLGFSFKAKDDTLDDRFRFLDKLRKGEGGQYALNVMEGQYADFPVKAFDYHYETYTRGKNGNRQTHHHYFSAFILEQPRSFPELRIYPEGWASKLGQLIGFEDIDFESLEFSKKFVVKSKEKKFAYDICHTRMMEFLLAHPTVQFEMESTAICLTYDNRLTPEQIEPNLKLLVAFRELCPEYLYEG